MTASGAPRVRPLCAPGLPRSVTRPPLWLTVDSDDIRHLPRHQGHPHRSRVPIPEGAAGHAPSEVLMSGMAGFSRWLGEAAADTLVTLFVIGDQLEDPPFRSWLRALLARHTGGEQARLTVGVHGWSHRSWSAWPADSSGFSDALARAGRAIDDVAGAGARHWFRAPAGYIAPWMAPLLADHGVILDSSVNPSWLLRSKTGRGRGSLPRANGWAAVTQAMRESQIIERPWLTTSLGLPACGPALHHRCLRRAATRAWSNAGPALLHDEDVLLDPAQPVTTVYWHLLDHARHQEAWHPPLPAWPVRLVEDAAN